MSGFRTAPRSLPMGMATSLFLLVVQASRLRGASTPRGDHGIPQPEGDEVGAAVLVQVRQFPSPPGLNERRASRINELEGFHRSPPWAGLIRGVGCARGVGCGAAAPSASFAAGTAAPQESLAPQEWASSNRR